MYTYLLMKSTPCKQTLAWVKPQESLILSHRAYHVIMYTCESYEEFSRLARD